VGQQARAQPAPEDAAAAASVMKYPAYTKLVDGDGQSITVTRGRTVSLARPWASGTVRSGPSSPSTWRGASSCGRARHEPP